MSSLLASQFNTGYGWLDTLLSAVINLINPILIVVSVAGIIYAIWVGIKFVKADEKQEREEAKSKLIMVIVGIVVVVLLVALFYFLAYNIEDIIRQSQIVGDTNSSEDEGVIGGINLVKNFVRFLR